MAKPALSATQGSIGASLNNCKLRLIFLSTNVDIASEVARLSLTGVVTVRMTSRRKRGENVRLVGSGIIESYPPDGGKSPNAHFCDIRQKFELYRCELLELRKCCEQCHFVIKDLGPQEIDIDKDIVRFLGEIEADIFFR